MCRSYNLEPALFDVTMSSTKCYPQHGLRFRENYILTRLVSQNSALPYKAHISLFDFYHIVFLYMFSDIAALIMNILRTIL